MAIHIHNPPKAEPERISRLVTRVESGDIKVPVFQRKFVWTDEQILSLLDSVYRGYPIGSLLFWLSDTPLAAERNLGDFELPPTPEHYPRNYILDGQQRLASIYGVLRWNGRPEERSQLNVSFDLNSKQFLYTASPPEPTHIPMNILFETQRFLDFQNSIRHRPDGADLIESSNALLETFREYSIPVVTVTEAPVSDVSEMFERINNTATRLTVYDLMIAMTWSVDFDLRVHVDRIGQELDERDFGNISPIAVLQTLAVYHSGSANKNSVLSLGRGGKASPPSPAELSSKISAVQEALRKATDFLISEVNVKSSDFLPYERQLVALAFVFARSPQIPATGIDVLRRWFWLTSFTERYRRGGEGLFDEDLATIVQAATDPGSTDMAKRFGPSAPPDILEAAEFRRGSALSSAFVALLASQHPKNLVNGSIIDTGVALSSYNRKEFHHIFPQAFLRRKSVSPSRINSLANICMLSAAQNKTIGELPPSEYYERFLVPQADRLEVLKSNLIPEAAVQYMLSNDYEGFVKERSLHLAHQIAALSSER